MWLPVDFKRLIYGKEIMILHGSRFGCISVPLLLPSHSVVTRFEVRASESRTPVLGFYVHVSNQSIKLVRQRPPPPPFLWKGGFGGGFLKPKEMVGGFLCLPVLNF